MHLIKISVMLTMLGARTGIRYIAVNPLKIKQIEKLIYPSGWPLGLLDQIYQQEAMWHIFFSASLYFYSVYIEDKAKKVL